MTDPNEREITLQIRIQRGRAIRDFLGSAAYTAHVRGYIDGRKRDLIEQAYASIENHPVLAGAVSAHYELALFEDSLQTTAKEADLTMDDLPEDLSPVIE